ncbi:RDD family protein [Geopsychrobacter electrodiphilus]|uniref:RDD family protein n=1 Tax=Geopsychrobacter electrodiphilus TaxID=225196 RepID=UPI0003821BA2|nr:RDD family protein [Geopsychrobacter electrodiphilus]
MQLTCPHCQHSKEVAAEKLPSEPTRVTCPQCHGSFSLPQPDTAPAGPMISCPACHLEQPAASVCTSCGLTFAKYRPPHKENTVSTTATTETTSPESLPKAGFWVRLVALLIDYFLVFVMQFIFGVLLAFIVGHDFAMHGAILTLIQLFSLVLSLFYWIFFTGYCGQTPGKMLLRIKVIVTDGSSLGYGKAFYREVIGKFISGIILGIGYLMAAFDGQKQSLHDRMAKTYVIKL